MGSVPGWGTKSPHAMQRVQKEKRAKLQEDMNCKWLGKILIVYLEKSFLKAGRNKRDRSEEITDF